MKKVIGILGVAVIAATMFFSANAVNGSTKDVNLASLLTMNTANAECKGHDLAPELNNGECFVLTEHCHWVIPDGTKETNCDTTISY